MSIEGTWDCVVDTPMGAQKTVLTFTGSGAALSGKSAAPNGEVMDLHDVSEDGNEAKWTVRIEKPIKLDVKCTVTVEGDKAAGKAILGMFGSGKIALTKRA